MQIFKETNNYGKASRQHYYGFERNFDDEYTTVHLMWGMEEQDMSSCDLKSSDYCTGTNKYDDTFNPNSAEAQMALLVSRRPFTCYDFAARFLDLECKRSHV